MDEIKIPGEEASDSTPKNAEDIQLEAIQKALEATISGGKYNAGDAETKNVIKKTVQHERNEKLKRNLTERMRKRKIPTNMSELTSYIDQEKLKKRKKLLKYLAGIAIFLALCVGVTLLIKYHTWSGYEVVASDDEEDTAAYSYINVGKDVLRYGIDSVRLTDADYNVLWEDTYTMSDPAVEICGETFCIYDKSGSDIITYNLDGRIGTATSSLPIVKATVAEQGVCAVICESSSETWIKYYDTDGNEIASFHTDISNPGYPMDIALSPDGLSMTVSYAFVEAGQINTQIAFYNFGSSGQNSVDNLIKVETYDNILAPQVEYVNNSTSIVFFENGYRVYSGSRTPIETSSVTLDETILSYDYSEKGVVMVLKNEEAADYIIKMYNLRGNGIFTGEFSFAYDNLQMTSDKILFNNSKEMMTYSMSGVQKFQGAIDEGIISTALDLTKNRYLIVTDKGLRTIRLR